MNTEYLTSAEAAKRLGISENRIRQLANAGRIGAKVGRDWLFTPAEIEAFAKEERAPGRPKND